MERTGHCSIEGARSYKRTSDTQQKELSDILNATTNIPQTPVSSSKGLTTAAETQPFCQPCQVFKKCTVNFFTGQQDQTACNTAPVLKRRRAVISVADLGGDPGVQRNPPFCQDPIDNTLQHST